MKTFENYYLYDYVRMAYRELTKKIDYNSEDILLYNLYLLLNEFTNEVIHEYILEEEII